MRLEPFEKSGGNTAEEIFAEDVKKANAEGVSENLSMPFFRRGSNVGVMLIHGFCSSPAEMGTLASSFEKRNFTIYVPRVAGHGTNTDDLASKSWADWYLSLSSAYCALRSCCDKIIIIGQSNGALLATAAAVNNKTDALGLLAPAFKVRTPGFSLAGTLRRVIKCYPRKLEEAEVLYNYKCFPLEAVYQMTLLQQYAVSVSSDIYLPVLAAVSPHDRMISSQEALRIVSDMKSRDKTIRIYDNRRYGITHVLTQKNMTSISDDICAWAERVANG